MLIQIVCMKEYKNLRVLTRNYAYLRVFACVHVIKFSIYKQNIEYNCAHPRIYNFTRNKICTRNQITRTLLLNVFK